MEAEACYEQIFRIKKKKIQSREKNFKIENTFSKFGQNQNFFSKREKYFSKVRKLFQMGIAFFKIGNLFSK